MTQNHTCKCQKRQLGIYAITTKILGMIVGVVDLDGTQNEFNYQALSQRLTRNLHIEFP